MFTGIITETGIVEGPTPRFSVRARPSFLRKLTRGDSVAVDGACLTVVGKTEGAFSADIMPETARRTTLGSSMRDTLVNLELPATPTTFLSGHIVQGHVDGVGAVRAIRKKGGSRVIEIDVPGRLDRYIAPKGSVAVNGVSLTVIDAARGRFAVGIIPHTLEITNFRFLTVGQRVNIEVDIFAKYALARQKAKDKRQK